MLYGFPKDASSNWHYFFSTKLKTKGVPLAVTEIVKNLLVYADSLDWFWIDLTLNNPTDFMVNQVPFNMI